MPSVATRDPQLVLRRTHLPADEVDVLRIRDLVHRERRHQLGVRRSTRSARFACAAVEFASVTTPAPSATVNRDAVPVTVHAPPLSAVPQPFSTGALEQILSPARRDGDADLRGRGRRPTAVVGDGERDRCTSRAARTCAKLSHRCRYRRPRTTTAYETIVPSGSALADPSTDTVRFAIDLRERRRRQLVRRERRRDAVRHSSPPRRGHPSPSASTS